MGVVGWGENRGPALQLCGWRCFLGLRVRGGCKAPGRLKTPLSGPEDCGRNRGVCGRNRGGIHGAPGAGGQGARQGPLVGILSAEESRETRPGGWECCGIGQPLSILTLSACGTSPTSWGVGPLPILRKIKSPDGARCPLVTGVGVPWAEDPASRRGGFVSTFVLHQAAGRLLEGRTGCWREKRMWVLRRWGRGTIVAHWEGTASTRPPPRGGPLPGKGEEGTQCRHPRGPSVPGE